MFTGLVEGCGVVGRIANEGAGVRLDVDLPEQMAGGGVEVGASVCINGCCLTVVEAEGGRLSFQAGPETLEKTNLGELAVGDRVNLERPLPADGRLGGHIVQGHVDGTGTVADIQRDDEGEWVTMWFQVPPGSTRQMVPKGSVAVDGVSLTLVDVTDDRFSVALIPHTLDVTTLGARQVGDRVNLETDVLGKYVQKLVQPYLDAHESP